MMQHPERWLDAYLDGELPEKEQRWVEAHLQTCETCRSALEQRRSLSALLQAYPPARDLGPAERFRASVRLQLPRAALQRASGRRRTVAWLIPPLGLLFVWAFLQMALWTAGLIHLIPGAEGALQPAGVLAQSASLNWLADGLSDFWLALLSLAGLPGPQQWSMFGGVALLLLVELLYGLWMIFYAGVSTGANRTE